MPVRTCLLNHPGGATGYRFDQGGRSLAILTDLEHKGVVPESDLVEFCHEADVIIYDAAFSVSDYEKYRGWGHSTAEAGLALSAAASAQRIIFVHHTPYYTDAMLSAQQKKVRANARHCSFGRQGQVIKL